MASLNQCNFIGNLGSDLELRWTQGGVAVGNVSIAVTEKYKEKETTTWVRLVFFGKQAELIDKYAGKGSSLFVSGRLQTRQWEKDGVTQYTTEVVASNFQFLGGNRQGGGQGQGDQSRQNGQGQHRGQNYSQGQNQQSQGGQYNPNQPVTDDGSDVPF